MVPEWLWQHRKTSEAHYPDYEEAIPSRNPYEPEGGGETTLLRDVAFNRHSMNDGHHVSPLDNGKVQVGADGIEVLMVQGIDEAAFKRVLSMATRATIGVDLSKPFPEGDDWEEMLKGGLQTALETAVVVFAVSGVSRTCTHQLVRSRRASFHQQSQRASYYGDHPEMRMPESVWRNLRARSMFMRAMAFAHEAYRVACEEDISYQDARYILPEGTTNYILCEYSLREFIDVFAYRGCSMFSWEIVCVMRHMRELLLDAYPWLTPYVKISCEKTGPGARERVIIDSPQGERQGFGDQFPHSCTFQGWENVEGQCAFPWARESNRTFRSDTHQIGRRNG
jgi:flavin-dependent thymidylate synthase